LQTCHFSGAMVELKSDPRFAAIEAEMLSKVVFTDAYKKAHGISTETAISDQGEP